MKKLFSIFSSFAIVLALMTSVVFADDSVNQDTSVDAGVVTPMGDPGDGW